MSRPTRPRLEPTTSDQWDDDTAALLDAVGHLNIFTTLAHHPKLLKRWMVFGGHVLAKSTLPARDRELVILRTGWRCDCAYEFGQHTVIGHQVGITEEEIARVATDGTDGWTDRDSALITAADELVTDHVLGDTTWTRLTADLGTEQILDLIFTVGQYTLVCMALNSLGVQLDDGVPGFPTPPPS
jgi:alkylhydroperoxidase family enzyme